MVVSIEGAVFGPGDHAGPTMPDRRGGPYDPPGGYFIAPESHLLRDDEMALLTRAIAAGWRVYWSTGRFETARYNPSARLSGQHVL